MSGRQLVMWDASALAKRYIPELGSSCVDALFAAARPDVMITSMLSVAETYSVLLRCRSRGAIGAAALAEAQSGPTVRDALWAGVPAHLGW